MSRNKENNKVLPSQTRANGSVFGSIKPPSGDAFFTDGLLDDTQLSKIPSPSPRKSKTAAARPRRAFQASRPLQTTRDSANTAHRSSSPSHGRPQARKHLQPAPVLTRPSNFRSSQQELITPPQSRDGPADLRSPKSDVSSPPRALTEVYQRIDDEQELAAAERDSSEEGSDMDLPLDDQPAMQPIQNGVSRRSNSSRGSTPVRRPLRSDKENLRDDWTGSLSEGTGVSFLKGMEKDEFMAGATPAMSSAIKDMKRLRTGISSQPITFNAGARPFARVFDESLNLDQKGDHAKPKAFALAGKVNGHERAHSDTSADERPRAKQRAFKLSGLASHQQVQPRVEDEVDETSTDEELRKRERIFRIGSVMKKLGSSRSPSKTSDVDDTQDDLRVARNRQQGNGEPDEQTTDRFDVPADQRQSKIPAPIDSRSAIDKWRQSATDRRPERSPSLGSQASSILDWNKLNEDKPIPSIEQPDTETPQASPPRSEAPESIRSKASLDRLKRWDNDFTGTSFQVSESPAVKGRKNVDDYVRDSEMRRLSKSAVTTNRLDAIRGRDPREAHRRLSKSPSATSLRKVTSKEEQAEEATEMVGEQIPDTPVVVFRSSSGSQKDTPKLEAERPGADRSTSHDLMQRLSRLSTTPRSTPPPITTEDEVTDTQIVPSPPNDMQQDDTYLSSAHAPEVHEEPVSQKALPVAATPKVMGAWTDTILPDTIKPAKQREKEPAKYAQTPHVNAGGWVDTPLNTIKANRQSSAMAPMTIEEETEELDTDVVPKLTEKPPQSRDKSSEEVSPVEMGTSADPAVSLPKSAWASIRNQQKQLRVTSADITDAAAQDTLVLGDATLASLDEALDLTDRDLTALIRLGAEQEARLQQDADGAIGSENATVQLDRLFTKLHSLQTNIHATRKGISHLEKEVAKDPANASFGRQEILALLASLPQQAVVTFSPVGVMVPYLFDKPNSRSKYALLGKPTKAGWALITFMAWYLLECLLAEIFCHPLTADTFEWSHNAYAYSDPSFGLVLPTVLLRSVGFTKALRFDILQDFLLALVSPVYTLLRAFYRIIGMWVGWTDGFVDETRERIVGNASQVMQRVVETVAAGIGGYGMDDDEFI